MCEHQGWIIHAIFGVAGLSKEATPDQSFTGNMALGLVFEERGHEILEPPAYSMDFELLPSVSLRPRSFNALVASNEMFAKALNRNLNLQRFKVLYICGNYSSVLSRLDRRFLDLEIRRAFTVFQLMTILEEARHSLIIIEHDRCSTRTPRG